jgi:hypothetical protein
MARAHRADSGQVRHAEVTIGWIKIHWNWAIVLMKPAAADQQQAEIMARPRVRIDWKAGPEGIPGRSP